MSAVRLSLDEALALCSAAARRSGASEFVAGSIARAAVEAEAEGKVSVGLSHLLDYLDAMKAGRIDGAAEPVFSRPAPALLLSDARGGAAHPGFDRCFEQLVEAAESFGVALFSQKNAYTCGQLGYFVGRLAERGLLGLAATNGPPLLAARPGGRPVYCTNPMALAAPAAGGPPLVIDQSSSATAFVTLRQAASVGKPIPEGWAVDAAGRPTTDAATALAGALLPFGGARGANVALMVEVLAAGLSGANWSLDAPPFDTGDQSPGSGLTIVAIAVRLLDPAFPERLATQLDRLRAEGVHVPGIAPAQARARAVREGIVVPAEVYARLAG